MARDIQLKQSNFWAQALVVNCSSSAARAMDSRSRTAKQSHRHAHSVLRVPARLIELSAVVQGEATDEGHQPQNISQGTRNALAHHERLKKKHAQAEANAEGCFLVKSTFGETTTYSVLGDKGPERTVLRVVDESYKNSQAKPGSQSSSSKG